MNRRHFALGALSAFGASRIVGANDRVRIGLIGSGGRGARIGGTFRKSGSGAGGGRRPRSRKGIAITNDRAKPFADFRRC